MHHLITITSTNSPDSARAHTHHQLRAQLIRLVRTITHLNLTVAQPSLTPLELLSQQLLLVLHHADRPLTAQELGAQLLADPADVDTALARLLTDQMLIPYTSETPSQDPTFDITLTGRIQAQVLTSWTELVILFITAATPQALRDLQQSLQACLTTRHDTLPLHRTCVTCASFKPFHNPDDPVQPHHCIDLNHSLTDKSLRTTCPDHQLSPNS